MTLTGHTLGTANYLSPEQISGAEVSSASDIYSLGLVLLECLTGEVAYPGTGVEAAMARLSRQPEFPDSLPDGWVRLLGAMTDRDPIGRPGAAEIGVAVTGLADAPNPESTPTTVIRAQPEADVPHRPAVVETFDEDAPAATRVLPVIEPPASPPPAKQRRPRREPRRPERTRIPTSWIAGTLAALAIVVIVIAAALATSSSSINTVPRPAYPTVSGPLGSHLRQLQQDVSP